VPAEQTRFLDRVRARLLRLRDRSPLAAHGVRTVDRYLEAHGTLLAAAVSYYAFLALLPLIAVAFGVTSLLTRIAPSIQDSLRDQLNSLFPSLDVDALARAGITVGLIGLVILAYTGVKWVGSMRRSVSLLWDVEPRTVGYFVGLVRDIVALTLLGGCLLASVVFGVLAQRATSVISRWLNSGGEQSALVWLVVTLAALAADFLIGLVLFRALPHGPTPTRDAIVAAAAFALGFQVLLQLVSVIVSRASSNVVYGTFATTIGVLVWISYVTRLVLMIAAWTATGPGVHDHGLDEASGRELNGVGDQSA
jgi:membrane protein